MIRSILNLYLDGFVGLAKDKPASRLLLIQEGTSADSFVDLLQEWAWLQDLTQEEALKMRLWFQLSYAELGQIFGGSAREISQLLRNQRMNALPGYRPEKAESEGLSCFMVEQHLSPWIDGEISDIKTLSAIRDHLKSCQECPQRLEQFRQLNHRILAERPSEREITEDEWAEALRSFKSEGRKRIFRLCVYGVFVCAISAFLVWAIFSKPEKMPNVYEITG